MVPLRIWTWDLQEVREALSNVDAPALLGPAERARAARFRSRATQQDYVATHVAARAALAPLLGVPPGEVVLGRLPCPGCQDPHHGPPGLPGEPAWRISLSRTPGNAALAALEGHPVGIDLERPRALCVDLLADVTLTGDERRELLALPVPLRLPGFYRAWTRKEAVLKAVGIGIAGGVDTVDVQAGSRGPVLVRYASGSSVSEWLVRDVDLGDGLAAAVAQPAGTAGPITVLRPEHVGTGLPRRRPVSGAGQPPLTSRRVATGAGSLQPEPFRGTGPPA